MAVESWVDPLRHPVVFNWQRHGVCDFDVDLLFKDVSMKELVFLGAGAAADAGLPTNQEFRLEFARIISAGDNLQLQQVLNALGDEAKNPESILPLAEPTKVQSASSESINRLKEIFYPVSEFQLSLAIGQSIVRALSVSPYVDLGYLQPLIHTAINRGIPNFCLVTTNYDTTVESYCYQRNIWCKVFAKHIFDDLHEFPQDLILIKLRGSIDWVLNSNTKRVSLIRNVQNTYLSKTAFHVPCMADERESPSLVKEVLLSELQAYKERLEQADILTVVGCSFENERQNVEFADWANAKEGRCIRVVDPNPSRNLIAFCERLEPEKVNLLRMTAKDGYISLYE